MEVPIKASPAYAKTSKDQTHRSPGQCTFKRIQTERRYRKMSKPSMDLEHPLDSEVVRGSQINCEPSFSKQANQETMLQAAYNKKPSFSPESRRLDGEDRYRRRVFSRLGPSKSSTLPCLPVARNFLAVSSPPLWPNDCSSRVYRLVLPLIS